MQMQVFLEHFRPATNIDTLAFVISAWLSELSPRWHTLGCLLYFLFCLGPSSVTAPECFSLDS